VCKEIIVRFTGFAVLLVLFSAGICHAPAKADIFVWQDPESGLSLTFPDTWAVQNNQSPDTIFTIRAPSETDEARCVIKIRPENRFLIYPPRYDPAVQKIAYSTDFWKSYLYGQYEEVMIHKVRDQAGFGRGYASTMLSSYMTLGIDPAMKSSLGLATNYNDKAYILECTALSGAFANWRAMFQSIAGSVDFKKAHHEAVTGHYRNFLND
jgi:hypothetical protein